MLKFLGIGQGTPAVVPTDDIIPLHWFEDGVLWKNLIVRTLFVFDDVLDPEKLRTSLEKLVAREGYRKLGGRLRRKKATGAVEYHVPAEFSAARPAVEFTHVHHDMDASAHSIAAKIPKPSRVPSVVGNPEELSELVRGGTGGRTMSLDDYLLTDRPVLGIHVTTFRDRTCVSLSWPHLAFDAMGKKAIIHGWTLVLQGREEEIATPIGYDTDPLAEFGMHPKEPHLLADKRVGTPGMVGYALRNITGLAGPKVTRTVCVPAAFWERLYADVRKELAKDAASRGERAPFITEGDVLSAWWTRLLCASSPCRDSDATVTAQNAMSLRRVLGNGLLPSDRPYISVALGFPSVMHSARDILEKPLSWVALEFRRAINEQGTRAQVEAYAALQRNHSATMRMPILFGDSGMYNIFFSNWQKAGLFNYDFSAATARPRQTPLHASSIHCVQDLAFPEGWLISGKDQKGNYWISGLRAKGLWDKLEEELGKQLADQKK